MSYSYEKERQSIFTEDGIQMLMKIRDNVKRLADISGAFTVGRAISNTTGDSWQMLACLDYLEETSEIRKVYSLGPTREHIYILK